MVGAEGYHDADRQVSNRYQCGLDERQVVLELGADGEEDPRVARFLEIGRRLTGGFPDAEGTDVMVIWRELDEAKVKDLVCGVKHQVRGPEQGRVATDQGNGARPEILLEPTGGIRPDIEGA